MYPKLQQIQSWKSRIVTFTEWFICTVELLCFQIIMKNEVSELKQFPAIYNQTSVACKTLLLCSKSTELRVKCCLL